MIEEDCLFRTRFAFQRDALSQTKYFYSLPWKSLMINYSKQNVTRHFDAWFDRYPASRLSRLDSINLQRIPLTARTVFSVLHTGIEILVRTRRVTDRSNENEPDPRYFK